MDLSEFCRIKWERAMALKKKGAFQEAEKELKEGLEEQPDHPLLNASLAQLYLIQDRPLEAKIIAESILSVHPQHPQALYVLGEIFYREDRFKEALECFQQAVRKDPGPYMIHAVAKTLREMKHYDEALATLDAGLVKDRHHLRLMKEKALILNRMNRRDEALKVYEKINELDPDDSFTRKEIYRLKALNSPDPKVIHELETVVKLPSRKDDAQLHGLLGQKLKEAGKLKEALEEYRKATQLAPHNPFFLKQEGFCLYKLGAYEEAIQALSQTLRKDPNDYAVRTTLKKMYDLTGNSDGFITLLEEILKDHPHNVKLVGILKGLKKKAHGREPAVT